MLACLLACYTCHLASAPSQGVPLAIGSWQHSHKVMTVDAVALCLDTDIIEHYGSRCCEDTW